MMTKMTCCHYSLKKRENVQLVVLKVTKYFNSCYPASKLLKN